MKIFVSKIFLTFHNYENSSIKILKSKYIFKLVDKEEFLNLNIEFSVYFVLSVCFEFGERARRVRVFIFKFTAWG